VIRDNLVRFDSLPLVLRVPSLRDTAPGDSVRLALSQIDLWELTLQAEFEGKVPAN
jgi:exoribonuclease-2